MRCGGISGRERNCFRVGILGVSERSVSLLDSRCGGRKTFILLLALILKKNITGITGPRDDGFVHQVYTEEG
jgi:hypothetical protein